MLLFLALAGTSCGPEEVDIQSPAPQSYASDFVQEWFKLECTIVKETPGFFPPQAARAFGYTGVTLYESVVQGWPGAESLAGQIQGLEADMLPRMDTARWYNWSLVANAALADIMRYMFEGNITTANAQAIDNLEAKWKQKLSLGLNPEAADFSESFGKAMASAIYEYSKTDGGHKSYLDPFQLPYTWPSNAGAWVPTGATPNPLSPRWDSNRPFLKANIDQSQPPAHMAFSTNPSSEFYKEAMQVYQTVKDATSEQAEIARFWADDPFNTCTPTGHTFNIMTQLLEENDASLAMAAVAYGKLAVAENDAFISCWKAKYDYFLIRPVSYIRQYIDPSFNTLIGTPPFPAYTSGHATEAAAGSQIFIDMFTDGSGYYPFTDRTQLQFGFSVRNFSNFNQMAEECANSRLYGGIHYNTDNLNGLRMGRSIGDNVVKLIRWPNDF